MPNTFRDLVKNDFKTVIANSNEFGASVSITRGAYTTTGVAMIADLVQTSADLVGGTAVDFTSRDYLVARTDYVINGAVTDPAISDLIEDGGYEYEVRPIEGDRPFTWNDAHGLMLRIHVKRKGEA